MTYTKPTILIDIDIPDEYILINETFHSLQGEGYHTGKAAFFIRFAGCDIGCRWCDSKDAISVINSKLVKLDEIVGEAKKSKAKIVIITGGEPLLFDLRILTKRLRSEGKEVHIETCGAFKPYAEFDWLTLSPKKIQLPIKDIYPLANELKIIIHENEDFEFAEKQLSLVNDSCKTYLQPEWSSKDKMLAKIVRFIKKNPHWLLSLQTHKYIEIP